MPDPATAHPVVPFHWEIEYPEVFDRENPGFDAIVGNPPFAGKNTLLNGNREGYLDWLKALHAESHGNADLVAHFFRHAFKLLRRAGCFGLIATNTIGQGDTRATGLRWICTNGGTIYTALKRAKWPGQAAVLVSVVNVTKGNPPPPFDLDGRQVPIITAYLFHDGGHESPVAIRGNAERSFIGSYILGMGFTFDDKDKKGVANKLALMDELFAKDRRNAERIFPFIGGEEINDSPTHTHHRYVINFGDFPLNRANLGSTWEKADDAQRKTWLRSGIVPLDFSDPVAADWPDLLHIVEEKVKPERDEDNRDVRRKFWWRFAENTPALFAALRSTNSALALSQTSKFLGFTFAPTNIVFSHKVVVFPGMGLASFCFLQSRPHELWMQFFGSSLEDRPVYTPSDCFETFPFPGGFETNAALEAAGREYYEFRAALMQDLWLGLTEIYNLFHAPDAEALARLESLYRKRAAFSSPSPREARAGRGSGRGVSEQSDSEQSASSPQPSPPSDGGEGVKGDWRTAESVPADRSPLTLYPTPAAALAAVQRLRTLHAAMDTAVLTAYGWTDLLPISTCEFLLNYEDDDSESAAEEPSGRKKKKPWRFRWPDEVRDEVLARLLKLNAERAHEEKLAGLAAAPPKRRKGEAGKRGAGATPAQSDLLPPPQKDLFG